LTKSDVSVGSSGSWFCNSSTSKVRKSVDEIPAEDAALLTAADDTELDVAALAPEMLMIATVVGARSAHHDALRIMSLIVNSARP
jgi:hypothetical protein